ncbi:hypothetical protein ACQKMD_20405 [Viridibacillus sp. NPDC096237]|uniref:hypothetical protein n=1 Tax=Viridibacillus sp. NPDC096237 TaxID=3390721 RepID=UPI003D044B66
MFSIAGVLLVLSLSFASAASAGASKPHVKDEGGGGSVDRPTCNSQGYCTARP